MIPLTETGGKGDILRKESDRKKYSEGWDRIFGKKELTTKEIPDIIDELKITEEESKWNRF